MLHKPASFVVGVLVLALVGLFPVGAGADPVEGDVTTASRGRPWGTPNHVRSINASPQGPAPGWLASSDSRRPQNRPRSVFQFGSEMPLAPLHGQTGGAMNAAAEHGGTLWLGVGPRLIALDVSDPAVPVRVGRTAVLPAVIEDLVMDPSRPVAWLVAGAWLVGVDIARSDHPAEIARSALPGPAQRIALAADHVWLLLDDGRIVGVDVADPARPRMVGEIAAAGGRRAADVAGRGQRLFRLVIDEDGDMPPVVQVFDVSQPTAPRNLPPATLDGLPPHYYYYGQGQLESVPGRLWVRVSRMLAALRVEGDQLVEVGRDELDVGGLVTTMAIAGERAYVSLASGWSDNYGVAAFDISDPSDVRALAQPDWEVGRYPGVFSRAIAVVGDSVWVSSTGGVLTALDTRAGSLLNTVGAYATVGEIVFLAADAGYLFALANQSAQAIDVGNPTEPRHAGLLSAGYHYRAVAAEDGLAGLAIWGQSDMMFAMLQLVDVRDPRQPAVVFDERPPGRSGFTTDIDLDNSVLALAATGMDGGQVKLFDLTDPTAPDLMGSPTFDGKPEAVALAGGRLLTLVLGDYSVWLDRSVVQASSPSEDRVSLTSAIAKYPDAFMTTSDRHAFVLLSDRPPGTPAGERRLRLFAVDTTQPDGLEFAGASPQVCTPGCRPAAIAYGDGHVFIASQGGGLRGVIVIDVADVAAPRVAQVLATGTGARAVQVDGEWLFVATGSGGLDVFRRPAGGWNEPPVTPTPVPPLPTSPVPTRSPTSPLPTRSPTAPEPSPSPTPRWTFVLYLPVLHNGP